MKISYIKSSQSAEPVDYEELKCSKCGDTEDIVFYKGRYLCQGCIDDYLYD